MIEIMRQLYQRDHLESMLGEFVDDYAINEIENEVTEIDYRTGNRYWKEIGVDELNDIIKSHQL